MYSRLFAVNSAHNRVTNLPTVSAFLISCVWQRDGGLCSQRKAENEEFLRRRAASQIISLVSYYPADKIDKIVTLHYAVSLSYRIETCHKTAEHLVLRNRSGVRSSDNLQGADYIPSVFSCSSRSAMKTDIISLRELVARPQAAILWASLRHGSS